MSELSNETETTDGVTERRRLNEWMFFLVVQRPETVANEWHKKKFRWYQRCICWRSFSIETSQRFVDFLTFLSYFLLNAALYECPKETVEMIEISNIEQQTDPFWIIVLNKVRVGQQTESDINCNNFLIGKVVPLCQRACALQTEV